MKIAKEEKQQIRWQQPQKCIVPTAIVWRITYNIMLLLVLRVIDKKTGI